MRRALLLLASFQLLLPPGFCICRVESLGLRPAGATVKAPKRQPRCPCCKPVEPPRSARLDPTPPPSPQMPHAPACPANSSWELARAYCHVAAQLHLTVPPGEAPLPGLVELDFSLRLLPPP